MKNSTFPVISISLIGFHERKQVIEHKHSIVFHLLLHFVTVSRTFGFFTWLFLEHVEEMFYKAILVIIWVSFY